MNIANTIIISKNIFTSASKNLLDGAVAISDNKIIYVGDKNGADAFKGPDTKVMDFGDKTVTPGFIDAHVHVLMTALISAGNVYFSDFVDSEEATIADLASSDYAKAKKPGEWLATMGWYLPFWKEKTLPSKASLDKAFPNNPVLMSSGDGHCLWLNTLAMQALEVDENTPVPEGGSVERDENGKLCGIFHETANLVLMAKFYDEFEPELVKSKYIAALDDAISKGNTGVCDLSMMPVDWNHDGIREDVYSEIIAEGHPMPRINIYPEITSTMKRFNQFKDFKNTDLFRVGGAKQFFDGVSGTHTAWQTEPYSAPYYEGDRGMSTLSPERMEELILMAQKSGISIRIHAIGDASVHAALDSIEKAYKLYGRKPELQHVLEHVESILEEDFARLRDLNVIVSAQPGHCLIDPAGIENDLGTERTKLMWAFRRFLDDGSTLALGTDAPIIDMNPLLSAYFAVTRENVDGEPVGGWEPQQKISLEEAVIAHTLGGAKSCTMDKKLGTLEAGKLADIVVFDRNIFAIPSKELLETKVKITMIDGKIVYEA